MMWKELLYMSKVGEIWTLCCSIEKYKYWLPFLSLNTFVLWKDKGWWRSNNLVFPSALSSEDGKNRNTSIFNSRMRGLFLSSFHTSFIRSCQVSGHIRGTGSSQVPAPRLSLELAQRQKWKWAPPAHPQGESFCTGPCQTNGLFLQELPGMGEGVCGRSSITPRTLGSAVPQKVPQEWVFSPHPPAPCANEMLCKSTKSPWNPHKIWNKAKELHPRRKNPAGSWPLHYCSEPCQVMGSRTWCRAKLARQSTEHRKHSSPPFWEQLAWFFTGLSSLLRDLQPERKVNKNSHGWLAAGSPNCRNCGSEKVPERFIN